MEHTHKKLDLELSDLRTKLSQMGGLVVEQMERALGCLSDHDFHGTRIIIERDTKVNRWILTSKKRVCSSWPFIRPWLETSGS
jgi:hypothetical protein